MPKTILITGSTDGIGLLTAEMLAADGHQVILHGRNPDKLDAAVGQVSAAGDGTTVESHVADLSNLADVARLAQGITENHDHLDVLINNAGIFRTGNPITKDGLDVRFVVNTLAPWLLTHRLLPLLGQGSRVVNLSSAAQASVDADALAGKFHLDDEFAAYAQSKLAITMWTNHMAQSLGGDGPMVVAVNPGSLLASKMVKEGFGVEGSDLRIGADILCRAALSDEFADASGRYFDNDAKAFGPPHRDALDANKCAALEEHIEAAVARFIGD